jgi:hypothetical protein
VHDLVELRPIISTYRRLKGMNGNPEVSKELTESQLIVDKKTATVAAFALVAGMALWALFQNQMPWQTRETTANQIEQLNEKLTARIDTLTQEETADRGELTLLREKQDTSNQTAADNALQTQKGIDEIKAQLVAVQTRLDMMDNKKEVRR